MRGLMRPVRGDGGFQGLILALRAATSQDGLVTLTPALAERVARYYADYGQGGFQGRLGPLATRRIIRSLWGSK